LGAIYLSQKHFKWSAEGVGTSEEPIPMESNEILNKKIDYFWKNQQYSQKYNKIPKK
jgi:hypothetical protein